MGKTETFNVNGDTAAGAIAGALKADRLLLLTDVAGVKDDSGEVITQISADQVRAMIAGGTIAGGMIPKTETALAAIEAGVRAVVILDGRLPNATLLELFTEHGAGSIIRTDLNAPTLRANDRSGRHRRAGRAGRAARFWASPRSGKVTACTTMSAASSFWARTNPASGPCSKTRDEGGAARRTRLIAGRGG